MTKAVLRWLHSPDVHNLKEWQPHDPSRFGILIQAMIGPNLEPGEESFDFFVCTPAWLDDELGREGHRFGLYCLIVPAYDFVAIHSALQRLCDRISGRDWDEVATVLSHYGKWEFEHYRDTDPPRF